MHNFDKVLSEFLNSREATLPYQPMNFVYLIITAFLPALLSAGIAVKRKTPVSLLIAAFFAAAASIPPVLALQYFLHVLSDTALNTQSAGAQLVFHSFITAGLIEESVKAAAFGLAVAGLLNIQNKQTTEKTAGVHDTIERQAHPKHLMLIALFFGLVFSGFENIHYGLRYPQFTVLRLCTASVLHGTLGGFYARLIRTPAKKQAAAFLAQAVLLHGLYDFFTSLGGRFMLPAAAVIGLTGLSFLKFAGNSPIRE